jgi:quercetin dioxygenase-like cupin family protein
VLRRPREEPNARPADAWRHDGELLFGFVLRGEATLQRADGEVRQLGESDAVALPPGVAHAWTRCDGLELLAVALRR